MFFGSYRQLLVLALSLPELAQALGLGDIRVDSRLNEPLSAQIDIIGATPEELIALRASVANPEIFQRYNAERPAFLASAKILVQQDAQGRPVLNIQSTEAFTEPLVNLLVDLRWGTEELVREYSLLLDPMQFTSASPAGVAALADAGPSPIVQAPVAQVLQLVQTSDPFSLATSAALPPRTEFHATAASAQHWVAAHDTLRGIVRRAGARSEADRQRMMLAIFQANRHAFAGNINRLHRGALLIIPSAEEIQSINSVEAAREIRAQMTAWRQPSRPAARQPAAALALAAPGAAEALTPIPAQPELSMVLTAMSTLDGRVQFLQQALGEASRQLASTNVRIGNMEQRGGRAAAGAVGLAAAQAQPLTTSMPVSGLALALAFIAGGLTFASRRLFPNWAQLRKPTGTDQPAVNLPVDDAGAMAAALPATAEVAAVSADEPADQTDTGVPGMPAEYSVPECGATVEITQPVEIYADTGAEQLPEARDEPDTVVLEVPQHAAADGTSTALDYNLSDLDGQAQHVEMPGSLHDHAVVVERRRDVVNTLMAAIQKDPSRGDLRMKLLETLYMAAAKNLRAFKAVARDLARNPNCLSADEWQQVVSMGREIAADDALFVDQPESDIADCA